MKIIKKLSKYRNLILMLLDSLCIAIAYYLGTVLITDTLVNFNEYYTTRMLKTIGLCIVVYQIVFHITKRYKVMIRYEEGRDYIKYAVLCVISAIIVSMINRTFKLAIASSRLNLLAGIFISIMMIGYRILARYIMVFDMANKTLRNRELQEKKNILIIGAGNAANEIIKTINANLSDLYNIIGIIDDNKKRLNYIISGVKIIGNRNDIVRICNENKVDFIFFSISRIDNENKKEILNICQQTNAKVRILPGMRDVIKGKNLFENLRDVEIEDILGRDVIKLDNHNIENLIKNKTILVTGAGGSIGSELCRQIIEYNPKKLLMLDIYENSLYEIELELRSKYPNIAIETIIASIRDKERIDEIFKKYRPYIVFHAAAHKHVPLMEGSPIEAIKNNVFGTKSVIDSADKYEVKRFILISTDKAVNPTSVMGATKRICEMMVQAKDKESKTGFVAVRFGNVLGSNGSVVPIFKKQILEGGPVTVTHKDITRFFMTIPEAIGLILQATVYAKGGEIFVLDMGTPVKIYDLAESLIKLSGLVPNKDIKIEITGLRPGEKLYEELMLKDEELKKTEHKKIFITEPMEITLDEMNKKLELLENVLNKESISKSEIKDVIKEVVPNYTSKEDI